MTGPTPTYRLLLLAHTVQKRSLYPPSSEAFVVGVCPCTGCAVILSCAPFTPMRVESGADSGGGGGGGGGAGAAAGAARRRGSRDIVM